MEKEIKILTVEDSPQDLDLILQQLKRDGINYSSLNVDTRSDFIKELADYNPDIVISDYSLTAFDGLTAVELIKDLSPFTSVIIVSGLNNDDLAVLCIKKGADDYILKNNISRLGFAINGALENKKLKKEKELHEKKYIIAES